MPVDWDHAERAYVLKDLSGEFGRLPMLTRGLARELLVISDRWGVIPLGAEPAFDVVCRRGGAHTGERRMIRELLPTLIALEYLVVHDGALVVRNYVRCRYGRDAERLRAAEQERARVLAECAALAATERARPKRSHRRRPLEVAPLPSAPDAPAVRPVDAPRAPEERPIGAPDAPAVRPACTKTDPSAEEHEGQSDVVRSGPVRSGPGIHSEPLSGTAPDPDARTLAREEGAVPRQGVLPVARLPSVERPNGTNGLDACAELRAASDGVLRTGATSQQAIAMGEALDTLAAQHRRADLVALLGAFAKAGGFAWMTQRKPTTAWLLDDGGKNLADSIEQALAWDAAGRGPVVPRAPPASRPADLRRGPVAAATADDFARARGGAPADPTKPIHHVWPGAGKKAV